jgi:hypothetical protein
MLDQATAPEKMKLFAEGAIELSDTFVTGQLHQSSMEIHV